MKHFIIILIYFLQFNLNAQSFVIDNQTGRNMEIRLWKDSRLMNHHILNPGDTFTIPDLGSGVLLQFKVENTIYFTYRQSSDGFYEMLFDSAFIEEHSTWYRPCIGIIFPKPKPAKLLSQV